MYTHSRKRSRRLDSKKILIAKYCCNFWGKIFWSQYIVRFPAQKTTFSLCWVFVWRHKIWSKLCILTAIPNKICSFSKPPLQRNLAIKSRDTAKMVLSYSLLAKMQHELRLSRENKFSLLKFDALKYMIITKVSTLLFLQSLCMSYASLQNSYTLQYLLIHKQNLRLFAKFPCNYSGCQAQAILESFFFL